MCSGRFRCGALVVGGVVVLHAHYRSARTGQTLASVCLLRVWRGRATESVCVRIFFISKVTWM